MLEPLMVICLGVVVGVVSVVSALQLVLVIVMLVPVLVVVMLVSVVFDVPAPVTELKLMDPPLEVID